MEQDKYIVSSFTRLKESLKIKDHSNKAVMDILKSYLWYEIDNILLNQEETTDTILVKDNIINYATISIIYNIIAFAKVISKYKNHKHFNKDKFSKIVDFDKLNIKSYYVNDSDAQHTMFRTIRKILSELLNFLSENRAGDEDDDFKEALLTAMYYSDTISSNKIFRADDIFSFSLEFDSLKTSSTNHPFLNTLLNANFSEKMVNQKIDEVNNKIFEIMTKHDIRSHFNKIEEILEELIVDVDYTVYDIYEVTPINLRMSCEGGDFAIILSIHEYVSIDKFNQSTLKLPSFFPIFVCDFRDPEDFLLSNSIVKKIDELQNAFDSFVNITDGALLIDMHTDIDEAQSESLNYNNIKCDQVVSAGAFISILDKYLKFIENHSEDILKVFMQLAAYQLYEVSLTMKGKSNAKNC